MGRIGGLLVLWLIVSMVGFTIEAASWLAIVGMLLFVATGVFGAIKATEHPSAQRGWDGPLTSESRRVRVGRRQPRRVRGAAGRGANHRRSDRTDN